MDNLAKLKKPELIELVEKNRSAYLGEQQQYLDRIHSLRQDKSKLEKECDYRKMLEESAEGKLKAIRQAIETVAAVRNRGLSFDILSVARVKEEEKNETDCFLEYLHRLSI